jgi:C-terminal processing protease CtpA/Prc
MASGALALLVALVAAQATAADGSAPFAWRVLGGDKGYTAEGSGDPRSEAGAHIVVKGERVAVTDERPEAVFGGAVSKVDAVPLRGSRIVIDADLAPADGAQVVSIWMRADDANMKPVEFATSQAEPVPVGKKEHRSIALRVPERAQLVVFGVVLQGQGSLVASNYRLRVDAKAAPKDDIAARATIDAAIDIVRSKAYHANAIDWSTAAERYRVEGGNASTAAGVHMVIGGMLNDLGDHHSFLMPPDEAGQHKSTGRALAPPLVELRGDGIGYVRMPAFFGTNGPDETAFAQGIADAVAKIGSAAKHGWIVDLRDNGGGNMWPMLAGLRALLGEGEVGGFRDRDGKVERWRAGDAVSGVTAHGDLSGARVAVLIGPRTASSGEAVAVAFHGRPNTRSFGHATAGLANANSSHALPDGSMILLTTAIDVDRNGVVFGKSVEPDEKADDADVIDVASKWLRSGRQ